MIEVIDPGRLATVQDLGRPGLERFGIPPGGAADWFSAAVANRLVGNKRTAALLEFAGSGPTLMFRHEATMSLTGAGIDRHSFEGDPRWRAHHIRAGTAIALGRLAPGVRGYLAVRGGIDVPIVLGSRSLCQRGSFGGGFGRPLRAGDPLPIADLVGGPSSSRPWPDGHRLPLRGPWEVRVIAGPHGDAFSKDALARFLATACRISPETDRMGARIDTPGLRLQADEILTTPMTRGAIQVTPSGQLIALLVDHPTTGGYPVIATVITADIPLVAQARPGDTVRFREVDAVEATRAHRRLTDWLADD
jgi:antagonist of KipI